MSLSELYRLPVSNLRLSAHASVPSSRKKSQQSLPKQNEFCGCYYASALFSISIAVGYLHNNWSPLGRAVFPCAPTACQKPVLFFCLLRKGFFFASDMMLLNKNSWKPHCMFAAQNAAVGPFAKSARPSLNFFFSHLHRAEVRTRKLNKCILISLRSYVVFLRHASHNEV